MKTKWVLDASVSLKWFFNQKNHEAETDQAYAFLQAGMEEKAFFLQPSHWLLEIAAVLARKQPTTATEDISRLQSFSFYEIIESASIYKKAIDLSIQLNHHLFDTLYHAIALEEKAELVTADEIYYNKARSLGKLRLLKTVS